LSAWLAMSANAPADFWGRESADRRGMRLSREISAL
jgi:hypothetical protein